MKLHFSPVSPFVRRVMVVAHEKGLAARIDCVRSPVQMTTPNLELMRDNPLGKVPALVLDNGEVLFDSTVICEYLDEIGSGPRLYPADPALKWKQRTWASLGVGMADILLLLFRENLRPPELRMQELKDIFVLKLTASVAHAAQDLDALETAPFGIGQIALGCAIDYLDFRFPEVPWRSAHPALARWADATLARPSFVATEPRPELRPLTVSAEG